LSSSGWADVTGVSLRSRRQHTRNPGARRAGAPATCRITIQDASAPEAIVAAGVADVLDGSTEHFQVKHRSDVTTGSTLGQAVLSTCEADYHRLADWFGGITPGGLPFKVTIQNGSKGASHAGCAATGLLCDAFSGNDADLVRMLVVAEEDEVFMSNFGHGWDCGASNGEALSRILAAEIYPKSQTGFWTGASWLDSNRPDFINSTDATDTNFVSIGCGTLFINYLRNQLGFSINQIITGGGSTFKQTYNNLTKDNGNPFPVFADLLQSKFPAGHRSGLANDNPWPISSSMILSLRSFASAQGIQTSDGIRSEMSAAGFTNLRGWLNSNRPASLIS